MKIRVPSSKNSDVNQKSSLGRVWLVWGPSAAAQRPYLSPWEILSKEALTLQPPPKNISSHTEKKSRAKRKRNYSMHYRNRHKIVRRNGEHGQNTQSIIHYAVKLCCIYVLIDDRLRIDCMNQRCVLFNNIWNGDEWIKKALSS